MRKRLISFVSIIALLFLFVSTTYAAFGDKTRYFDTPVTGIQGHMSTMASASLPSQSIDQRFYLELRPQNSCLAAIVSLVRQPTSGTGHYFYFADYCDSGGLYSRDLTSNANGFRDLYVKVQSYTEPAGLLGSQVVSDETIIPRIVKVNATTWNGYLYNHTTGVFDLKLTAVGTATSDVYHSAYSIFPSNPTACSTLGTYGRMAIWDTKLQVTGGGAFNLVQSGDVDALVTSSMPCVDTTGNPWEFVNISQPDDLIIRKL